MPSPPVLVRCDTCDRLLVPRDALELAIHSPTPDGRRRITETRHCNDCVRSLFAALVQSLSDERAMEWADWHEARRITTGERNGTTV